MTRRLKWIVACALAGWWTAGPVVAGQIGSGTITGSVTDGGGAVLPGASIAATAVATGAIRRVATAADGAFVLAGLLPGPYELRIDLAGFRPVVRRGLLLATGETIRVDLQLELGGASKRSRHGGRAAVAQRDVRARPGRRQPQGRRSCR